MNQIKFCLQTVWLSSGELGKITEWDLVYKDMVFNVLYLRFGRENKLQSPSGSENVCRNGNNYIERLWF